MKKTEKKTLKTILLENLKTLGWAVLIAHLIRIFILEAYKIPSSSMIPTLIVEDQLLVNKFILGVRIPILGWKLPSFTKPRRGQIIVFHYPKYHQSNWTLESLDLLTFGILGLTNTRESPRNFIKRLIALPGDTYSFQKERITVNDKVITHNPTPSKALWNRIKSLQNPSGRLLFQNSNQSYYKRLPSGNITGGNNSVEVLSENIDGLEHLIQIYDWGSVKIPFLYIPKKGDHLELILENENGLELLSFLINGKLLRKIPRSEFFFSFEPKDFHYNQYYNKELFLRSKELQSYANLESLLLDKAYFSYRFQSNYYWMMGDNRDDSSDSRSWGFVREDFIIGTPIILYWPLHRFSASFH